MSGTRNHCSPSVGSCLSIRLLGKAAFQLGEHGQAEAAYRRAVTVNPSSLLAWKGLSELFISQGAITSDFIETQEKLVGSSSSHHII